MKIVTTVFDYQDCHFDYGQLHHVFVESCHKHMPGVEVITLKLDVPQAKDDRKPGLWTNTCKLRAQVAYLEHANDDVVFSDCDMLCLRSIEDVWVLPFDIGYTVKPENKKTRCRLNGGVLFVRNNAVAHEWMRQLLDVNNRMYEDPVFHNKWRSRFFGMNQSAMGCMIETSSGPGVMALPTHVWNAVDCDWKTIDAETRFVHIKGKLRRAIFSREGYHYWYNIMKEWYSYTGNQQFVTRDVMPWDRQPVPPTKRIDKKARVRGHKGRVRI